MEHERLPRRAVLRGALAGGALFAAPGLLTACGSDGGGKDGADPNAGVKLPAYVPFDEGREPDLPGTKEGVPDFYLTSIKDDQFIKGTDGKPGDGKPVSCMSWSVGTIPPAMGKNRYWQEVNKRIGSEMRFSLVPTADYDSRFAVTVSGGDLPNWFSLGEINRMPQFLETQCQDLTEFLSGDAVKEYPFLANIPTESWRGCVYSGGIYALPIPRGVGVSFFNNVRTDLFRKKGLNAAPETIDELMDAAKEITDSRRNVWAFAGPPMMVLPQMYGVPNQWGVKDGEFTHMIEHEGYRESLALGRRMVKEGLVHPDGVGADYADWKSWFIEGSATMAEDTLTGLRAHYGAVDAPEGMQADWMPPPSQDGTSAGMWIGSPNVGSAALRKADPDRIRTLLKIANWLCTPAVTEESRFRGRGIEGVHSEKDEQGLWVRTDKGNAEMSVPFGNLVSGPFSCSSGQTNPDLVAADRRLYKQLKERVPEGRRDPAIGLYSTTKETKGIGLDTQLRDATNSILLGRQPVSSWKDVVAKWRREGGDRMRDEYEKADRTRARS